jgi:predicted S18 family serine protease
MREKILALLLVLSLAANAILLLFVFVPDESGPLTPGENAGPETVTPALATGGGNGYRGERSMLAPVILQRIEIGRDGPFAREQVTEEGAMVEISVEVEPGQGRVLVETMPRMGLVFQEAANNAFLVARDRATADLSESDVIFSIQARDEVSAIDGPSAGALMTVLLLSVLEDFSINESVTMTGTIRPDGSVGRVDGILDKAGAAAAGGKTLLILPRENSRLMAFQEVTDETRMTEQQFVEMDTRTYIEENFGIEAAYIDTIDDALAIVRLPENASEL